MTLLIEVAADNVDKFSAIGKIQRRSFSLSPSFSVAREVDATHGAYASASVDDNSAACCFTDDSRCRSNAAERVHPRARSVLAAC